MPSATRSLASRNFERVAQLEVEQVNQTERDERKSVVSDDLLLVFVAWLAPDAFTHYKHNPGSQVGVSEGFLAKGNFSGNLPGRAWKSQHISANTQRCVSRFRGVPPFSFGPAVSMGRLTNH